MNETVATPAGRTSPLAPPVAGADQRTRHAASATEEQPARPQAENRASLVRKRIAVIAGLALLSAGIAGLCFAYGPQLLAFVADAPRFRAWVDEYGIASRLAFVAANVAQIVFAFLPGEPLELAAGYAFGFWEGTLLCLVASAIGTALVMALVRQFGMRIVSLFFPPEKTTSLRWLQNARRFELVLFLVFLVPGTPKDLLTYVAGLGTSSLPRIVASPPSGASPPSCPRRWPPARSATATTWAPPSWRRSRSRWPVPASSPIGASPHARTPVARKPLRHRFMVIRRSSQ